MKTFTVDTVSCVGCLTCVVACKDRADLPDDLDWLRVVESVKGVFPDVTLTFLVLHCFHCVRAPCIEVCPTEAIARDDGGWVQIDPARCVGCETCLDVCPYDVIVMSPDGLATKCDGCADEIAEGRQPTCVRACPMHALDLLSLDQVPDHRVVDRDAIPFEAKPRVLYLRRP